LAKSAEAQDPQGFLVLSMLLMEARGSSTRWQAHRAKVGAGMIACLLDRN